MTAPDKPGLSNEELKPEVQAALSGGRDERWEKLEVELKEGIDRNLNSAEYQRAIEDIYARMESMSAKEGE